MASGLPVISLNGKGNSDLIENGKNGYILEEENSNLFSQKIIHIQKNHSEREILIQNGFSTAKNMILKNIPKI